MDTLAELVYEKADIDTRIALHQAYGIYKSIFYVQNFVVPRAKLEKELPSILAKRQEYPDVITVQIHEGYTLVRNMNNTFIHEEVIGPAFPHTQFWDQYQKIKYSTHPMNLRHWSLTLDSMLPQSSWYKHPTIEEFFHNIYVHDERFLPFIQEKIEDELNWRYSSFCRSMVGPFPLGLPDHLKDGYYECQLRKEITYLEDFNKQFQRYADQLLTDLVRLQL